MDKNAFDSLFLELAEHKVVGNNSVIVQINEELWEVVKVIQQINAKRIMEIGANFGGTLKVWERVSGPDAKILSLDLEDKLQVRFGDTVSLIYGDSHSSEVVAKVFEFWKDEKIDFLYIDGDHSYEGVKADFENFHSLVRKGGVIGFHDVNHPPVHRFWQEINIPCSNKVIYDYGLSTGLIKL